MTKQAYKGPNKPCTCGSGRKYKKCCGPRGGLTEIEYAEEMAYREERSRNSRGRSRKASAFLPLMMGFASMAYDVPGPGPMPPKPKKRGRRNP